MPIYEYQCSKCGDFEIMQRMSDKPLSQCPTCRRKVTKLISSTTFQLKGSGWYITDYARKGEGSGKADKKSEAKTESPTSDSGSSSDAGGDGGGAKSEKKTASKKSEKAAAA
jgi:putative FmdB family regulatory protein